MMHQTQKTRRGHPSILGGLLAKPSRVVANWLTAEHIAELVGFYSAQWSHLAALDDAERWQRPVPARPAKSRAAELRELYHGLQQSHPPTAIPPVLLMDLNRTLQLAEAFVAGGVPPRPDKPLLKEIEAHQQALEKTRDELLNTPVGKRTLPDTTPAALKAAG